MPRRETDRLLTRLVARKIAPTALAASALLALTAVAAIDPLDPGSLSAGTFTTSEWGTEAFSLPASSLSAQQMTQFAEGKEQFAEPWGINPKATMVWGWGRFSTRTAAVNAISTTGGRKHRPMVDQPNTEW